MSLTRCDLFSKEASSIRKVYAAILPERPAFYALRNRSDLNWIHSCEQDIFKG
jgi:hypothetical protein